MTNYESQPGVPLQFNDEFDILLQNCGLNFLDNMSAIEDTSSYIFIENPHGIDSDYHEISSVSSTTTSVLLSSQKEIPYASSLDELIDQVINDSSTCDQQMHECILDLSDLNELSKEHNFSISNHDSCIDLEEENSDSDDLHYSNDLKITDEEKSLLLKEGFHIPSRLPLTKSEEKALMLVRRKIRNKRSAKSSRERKKTYVEGLEKRVDSCTKENHFLREQIRILKEQNSELSSKLQKMRTCLVSLLNKSNKPKISVCVLFVSFLVTFCIYPLFDVRQQSQLTIDAKFVPNIINTNVRRLMSVAENNLTNLPSINTNRYEIVATSNYLNEF